MSAVYILAGPIAKRIGITEIEVYGASN